MNKIIIAILFLGLFKNVESVEEIKPKVSKDQEGNMQENKKIQPIGTATMLLDETIVLYLRAETDGAIGHAQFKYVKGDEKYCEILKHIGGLKPGQEKVVLPFPEK